MSVAKVSIIIPVYNVEKYLAKCLDSIINQTYSNLEIICINDGSPDNSLEILKEYEQKDKRIVLIEQANAGVSAARNRGIEFATGDFMIFVDSDDWCELDLIEKALENFNDDVDLIYWGTNIVAERNISDSELLIHKRANACKLNGKYPVSAALVKNLTGRVSNKLFKAKIIKDYNLKFPNSKCYEDLIFNLNYYIFTRNIFFISENLDYYLLRENSAITQMAFKEYSINALLKLFEDFYNNCKEHNSLEKFDKIIFLALFQRFIFNLKYIDTKKQYSYLKQIQKFFESFDKSYDWSQNIDINNILNGYFDKYLDLPRFFIGNKFLGLFLYRNNKPKVIIYLLGIKLSFKLNHLIGGNK